MSDLNSSAYQLLKSTMRADPDVLMIGEIRDSSLASDLHKSVKMGQQIVTTASYRDSEEIEDFKLKLSNALLDLLTPETAELFDDVSFTDDGFRWDLLIEYACINSESQLVKSGLLDVDFTPENISLSQDENNSENEVFFGFHALNNGFAFLGVRANPEFEAPIAFVLTLDENGDAISYVPEKGNNYDVEDKASYEWSDEDVDFDQDLLLEDTLNKFEAI